MIAVCPTVMNVCTEYSFQRAYKTFTYEHKSALKGIKVVLNVWYSTTHVAKTFLKRYYSLRNSHCMCSCIGFVAGY